MEEQKAPNHFHLRLTPTPKNLPAITPDMSGLLKRFDQPSVKYVLAHEVSKDGIPHYHLYVEGIDVSEKTLRNYITESCNIPKGKRGQSNGYYVLKHNAYRNPSPAYVSKEGDIRAYKDYSQEEVEHYIEAGIELYKPLVSDQQATRLQIGGASEASAKKTIEDLYAEYVEAILPKDKTQHFDLWECRKASRKFWKERGGLLPVESTYKRFVVSAMLDWQEITRVQYFSEYNDKTFTTEDALGKYSRY